MNDTAVRRAATTNRWVGRPYGAPIAVVLHTQSGGESGTVAEFLNSAAQFSAHYTAHLDGQLDCFIDPGDRAWANGIVEPGSRWPSIAQACGVDPALNPNHVTIACETEDDGMPHCPVTDAQFSAVVSAIQEAQQRFPTTLLFLARHADISPQSRPDCPGQRWTDSGRFRQLADRLGLRTLDP